MAERAFHLPDLAATARLASSLAPLLRPGDVIALWGDLGAGKTAFARFLIQALGADGDIPSPTFNLVLTYPLPGLGCDLWHFDLYRLSGPDEAYELGIEDAFDAGVSLIEWPDRLGPLLPAERLDIRLEAAGEEARDITLAGHRQWSERLKQLPHD